MKIGPYEVTTLEAGDFKLDGGAMFGVIPKILWNRVCPADDSNRIGMTMRALLVESGERKILVDAGVGHKESDSFNEMFAVDFSRNSLEKSLSRRSLKPEEITDFIYTHLHFDHAGGSTRREGKDVVSVFPNAVHYVQRKQYRHALSRNERDRASYLPYNYEPVREAGLLEFVDGNTELMPGVELIVSSGHTPGLQTVKISDGSSAVWFPTDLIPMAAHIPLPYIMGYDLAAAETLADKKKLLPRAVEEKWTVVFQHDPEHLACRIIEDERGRLKQGDSVSLD